jgi:hypothetical protein
MAVRATYDLGNNAAKIKTYTVASGQATTEGRPVKFASADEEVQTAGAGEACWGIALETKAAGERVQVLVSEGDALVKVKVGTGGATRGAHAVIVADGVTNSGTLGGGSTLVNVVGTFAQTGVAGDVVGMKFRQFAAVKA